MRIKSICVFGGTADGADGAYLETAEKIGILLAKRNIKIIFGGGGTGIMGALAKSALKHGGQVIGLIPDCMREREDTLFSATQLIIADNMHDRKLQMYNLSDGFLVLPGGMGTIDEASEVLCWLNLGLHDKKFIIANIKNYWLPFLKTLKHGMDNDFINTSLLTAINIIQSLDELEVALDNFSVQELQSSETVSEQIHHALKISNNPIETCVKVQELAALNGFKWDKLDKVIKKITEEINELEEQTLLGNSEKILEEYGDLLFAVMNLSVHLNLNYKDAIKIANNKFLHRYSRMENLILEKKQTFKDFRLDGLLEIWEQVKKLEAENY